MEPLIRRLAAEDIALFHRALSLFGEAFGEPETYGAARPGDAYVRRLLARDGFVLLAAIDGDEVIGALAAYELPKYEQARSEIYIYDLAVAEPYRRRGIATALIAALKPIARAAGAWVIFVQADPIDPPAIAFYTKLGVCEDVLHFDIPVA